MPDVRRRRTGTIHRFAEGEAAPSPMPARRPRVDLVDAGTLARLGGGQLVGAVLKGRDLVGTIEWPAEAEAIVAGSADPAPAAYCEFAPDGTIAAVRVEVEPRAAGCACDGACSCHSGTVLFAGKKLSGGRWATVRGRHIYIKGGKVVAGHIPGVTPEGTRPAKGEEHTVESYAAKHKVTTQKASDHLHDLHAAGGVAQDPQTGKVFVPHGTPRPQGAGAPKSKLGRAIDKGFEGIARHEKATAAVVKAVERHQAAQAKRIEMEKSSIKAAREAHAAKKKAAGAEDHTAESYARAHGIGGANAFAHLDALHKAGKVVLDKQSGKYHLPAGTPNPGATPAKGAAGAATTRDMPAARPRPPVKYTAPRTEKEWDILEHARATGKAAVIVRKAPEYRADRDKNSTHHVVGGERIATHHVQTGKHVVTVHHGDGSRSVYRHKDKEGAKAHLQNLADAAIRRGTVEKAVVGSNLKNFDAKKHGLAGEHHRTEVRVLAGNHASGFSAAPIRTRGPRRPVRPLVRFGMVAWPGPSGPVVDVPIGAGRLVASEPVRFIP